MRSFLSAWEGDDVTQSLNIRVKVLFQFEFLRLTNDYYNIEGNGKVCMWAKWLTRLELIPISVAWSDQEYFYSPLSRWSGYPSLMMAISCCMSGSDAVLARRSDIFWSETGKFVMTKWTWASKASCVSSTSLRYKCDNVSATGISFPGLWWTVKSYF